jgi:hypothetical protein
MSEREESEGQRRDQHDYDEDPELERRSVAHRSRLPHRQCRGPRGTGRPGLHK